MQDSDDYLFDAFGEIDADTLAAIEEEESKYLQSRRTSRSLPEPQLPPPPKRQRLSYGWNAGPARTISINSLDELPEISVHDDGGYDIEPHGQRGAGGIVGPSLPDSTHNDVAMPGITNSHKSLNERSRIVSTHRHTPGTQRIHRELSLRRQGHQDTRGTTAAQNLSRRHDDTGPKDDILRHEIEQLRADFEKLRQEQEQTYKSLKEAEDARLAKEGEVSILRKGIERTAQDHAAELARIRAAKETAEAMQIQLKKEMKEEVDRLKTQFTFKQHELETSGRTSPWTVRSKRINRQAPPTPIRMPSQMQQWVAGDKNAESIAASPSPNQARIDLFSPPDVALPKPKSHAAAEKSRKPPSFPGFENAFSSSPPRSQGKHNGKGKEREPSVLEREAAMPSWFSRPNSQRAMSPPVRHLSLSSPPSSPTRASRPVEALPEIRVNDRMSVSGQNSTAASPAKTEVNMADEVQHEPPAEDIDVLFVPDRRAELQRLILTHRLPSCDTLTIQLLMRTTLSDNASPDQERTYNELHRHLLDSLANVLASASNDEDKMIISVLSTLVKIASILRSANTIGPLVASLNLVRILALYLPSSPHFLLSQSNGDPNTSDDDSPPLLILLCDIFRDQLAPKAEAITSDLESLAKETFGLLEVLTWSIPTELAPRLSVVLRTPNVLMNILAPSQPSWLLYRATRMLALMASHHSLFRHFLSMPPESQASGHSSDEKDFSKIPHIERLGSYLMDKDREGREVALLKETILILIATLSMAHADALMILVQSQTLIPSVIVFLTQLTTPFFEEDPSLMRSLPDVEVVVIRIVRTVSLLYRLVFGANSDFSLRQKVLNAPYREFHGIQHMLLVTLGRLSYADPPHELSAKLRGDLDQTIDMAKGLLELLVDGPEHELVWAAFQVDPGMDGNTKEDDDEEEEARKQHPIETESD